MSLWQKYKDQGLVVWGIGSQDAESNLAVFSEQMSLSFPVLVDGDGSVHAKYNPGQKTTNSVYPQDWLIGADGKVLYVNTAYEPAEIAALVEAELAK